MFKRHANQYRVLEELDSNSGLNPEGLQRVSESTGVPEANVWGAATFYSLLNNAKARLRVCDGLSCRVAGSFNLVSYVKNNGVPFELVSCLGQCDRAPVALNSDLEVESSCDKERGISPDDNDLPINLAGPQDSSYSALTLAQEMSAETVLDELERSLLQGRGGAGFAAHAKWRSVRTSSEAERYIVCNADEGEPGTFKDREIMLRQPHKLLEGLAIAAHVIHARSIQIYIRGEFKAERRSIERALSDAAEQLMGFEFGLVSGHGAYICGEETALLESLEGKRGMPRIKPPFPTELGLGGKPTLVHNVETIACIPSIVKQGGDWFRAKGRTGSGTKLYSISGHVRRPGVYERPLGVSLGELAEVAGGYMGNPVAFSPGGASSGFLPIAEQGRPLDYDSLAAAGSMLGSAGVVVLGSGMDMAEAANCQQTFFERESCGQCAPCRIGTRYLRMAVTKYLLTGDPEVLSNVDDVAWEMQEGSICGLGMTAPNPLLSALKHFPDAFGPRPPKEEM